MSIKLSKKVGEESVELTADYELAHEQLAIDVTVRDFDRAYMEEHLLGKWTKMMKVEVNLIKVPLTENAAKTVTDKSVAREAIEAAFIALKPAVEEKPVAVEPEKPTEAEQPVEEKKTVEAKRIEEIETSINIEISKPNAALD
uniref:Uncharacterized protein n=1 Tax=Plectus sambesii TaxID=2011161 RepID=A0A914VR54_9BILA